MLGLLHLQEPLRPRCDPSSSLFSSPCCLFADTTKRPRELDTLVEACWCAGGFINFYFGK